MGFGVVESQNLNSMPPLTRNYSPETSSAALPPRLAGNAQRGSKYSARGPAPGNGAMRSLSPALQVMQRNMLNPSPADSLLAPNAPRGERPREYLNALCGAAAFLEFSDPVPLPPAPSADMPMGRCRSPKPSSAQGTSDVLPRASSPRLPGSARRRPQSPSECVPRVPAPSTDLSLPRVCSPSAVAPGSARTRRPLSPTEDIGPRHTAVSGSAAPGSARRRRPDSARPATPILNEVRQDFQQRPLSSARVRPASADRKEESLPQVHSARGSRPRSLSARELARQLGPCDEKISFCPEVPRGLDDSMQPRRKSKTQAGPESTWATDRTHAAPEGSYDDQLLFSSVARSGAKKQLQPEADDDALGMDALDGLLASLDEERTKCTETIRSISPPAPDPHRKCGIGPVQKKGDKLNMCIGPGQSRLLSNQTYDDEVAVDDSPHSSFEIIDEGPHAGSIYCPLSPTMMSVHMPGSPIAKAFEIDDTPFSVNVFGDRRPCKVRFECRGEEGADPNKHMPQAPSRKPQRFGTGKLASRPLGCTMVQANFGGA